MKKLAALLMCSLVAAPAMAGEDSTDRYWGYGPAWYETECGLACFRSWELSGIIDPRCDRREQCSRRAQCAGTC